MLRAHLAALVCYLPFAVAVPSWAEPSAQTIAGHRVAVTHDARGEDELRVDGKRLYRNGYVAIDDVVTVGGVQAAIGSASDGSNRCDTAPFVLSFPAHKRPRLDGPVRSCKTVTRAVATGHIRFESKALEGDDGKAWLWTPAHGFKSAGPVKHVPDPLLGWRDIRAGGDLHPSVLLDMGEIAPTLLSLLGKERKAVLPLLNGVGSGAISHGLYVGSACRPHACPDAGVLVIADPETRQLYVAWKLENKKIQRRTTARGWSAPARAEFDKWSQEWR